MSYFKENHAVKKTIKTDLVSTSASTGTSAAFNTAMLAGIGSNFSDEILFGASSSLRLTNKLKGFFIHQGNCRLTIFNSASTAVRVNPFFSSNQQTTVIRNMQSSYANIRDNFVATFEGYPNLATALSASIDFTNSQTTFNGASANKASGEPELWFLPIGENA